VRVSLVFTNDVGLDQSVLRPPREGHDLSFQSLLFCSGGPSGSGKTALAHKLADILQCKVVSLERYYAAERVANENFDEFSALDVGMLLHVRLLQLF
jgi:hypothetical protein